MAVFAWSQVELFEKRLSSCNGVAQLEEWLNGMLLWTCRELSPVEDVASSARVRDRSSRLNRRSDAARIKFLITRM